MIKNRDEPLCVSSGLVVIGGIVFCILGGILNINFDVRFPFWSFGFMYIIPGILGLVAAFVQNKCMYIVALVFGILFLIGLFGVVVILGVVMNINIINTSDVSESSCVTIGDSCKCSGGLYSGYSSYISYDQPCEDYRKIRDFHIALFAVAVLTWIFLLHVFVFCCYYTCCAKSTATPGVAIQSGPQINVSVSQTSQQQNSQAYLAPVNTVPAYGGPQYGPYWYGAPNGQSLYHPPYGQNNYAAPSEQNVNNGHQQNAASPVEIHPLQEFTENKN